MSCRWWSQFRRLKGDPPEAEGATGTCSAAETEAGAEPVVLAWPALAMSDSGGGASLVTAAGFGCNQWLLRDGQTGGR